MELELRHLRNLCTIAEAGSFNRAAAALGLPQPALSRQVQRLEKLLGGPLFERDRRGVRPTPLGSTVLCYADTIIGTVDEVGATLTDHRQRQQRMLRIGWSSSGLYQPLLRALGSLREAGELRVITTDSSRELDDLLRGGQLDVAIRDESGRPPTPCGGPVAEVPIAAGPVFAVLPANHRLAAKDAIAMADLAPEKWISSSGPDDCHGFLNRLCGRYGFTPDIACDVPVCGPRDEVVAQQDCVSLSQALRCPADGVTRRPILDLSMRVHHSLAYHRNTAIAGQIPMLAATLSTAYWEATRSRPEYRAWLARSEIRPRSGAPVPQLSPAGR